MQCCRRRALGVCVRGGYREPALGDGVRGGDEPALGDGVHGGD